MPGIRDLAEIDLARFYNQSLPFNLWSYYDYVQFLPNTRVLHFYSSLGIWMFPENVEALANELFELFGLDSLSQGRFSKYDQLGCEAGALKRLYFFDRRMRVKNGFLAPMTKRSIMFELNGSAPNPKVGCHFSINGWDRIREHIIRL